MSHEGKALIAVGKAQGAPIKAKATLGCDRCHEPTYDRPSALRRLAGGAALPDWSRCIKCGNYFCDACMAAHACGTTFGAASK